MSLGNKDTDAMLTSFMGKTGSEQGIMLCLRFLAIQAISQGCPDLAHDIEVLLVEHESEANERVH